MGLPFCSDQLGWCQGGQVIGYGRHGVFWDQPLRGQFAIPGVRSATQFSNAAPKRHAGSRAGREQVVISGNLVFWKRAGGVGENGRSARSRDPRFPCTWRGWLPPFTGTCPRMDCSYLVCPTDYRLDESNPS